MSTFLERIGRFRRKLADVESASLGDRLRAAREQFTQTQRILIDASTHGNLDHSRQMATWHARLEIEEGATSDEVTAAFRRLVRLYHPDLYGDNPQYAEMANELTQLLVVAYQGILEHLGRP